jgi:hypothetical protein
MLGIRAGSLGVEKARHSARFTARTESETSGIAGARGLLTARTSARGAVKFGTTGLKAETSSIAVYRPRAEMRSRTSATGVGITSTGSGYANGYAARRRLCIPQNQVKGTVDIPGFPYLFKRTVPAMAQVGGGAASRSGLPWYSGSFSGKAGWDTFRGHADDCAESFFGKTPGWDSPYTNDTAWRNSHAITTDVVSAANNGQGIIIAIPLMGSADRQDFAGIVAGELDTLHTDMANVLQSNRGVGQKVWIRLGHEANAGTVGRYPWHFIDPTTGPADPTTYKAAWARIAAIYHALVPGVQMVWNLIHQHQGGYDSYSLESYYPGNTAVDVVGLDVYDNGGGSNTFFYNSDAQWTKMLGKYDPATGKAYGLQGIYDFAVAHGKKFSIDEWAPQSDGNITDGSNDGYFVTHMVQWFAAHAANIAFESFFNYSTAAEVTAGNEPHQINPPTDHLLNPSDAYKAAYRAIDNITTGRVFAADGKDIRFETTTGVKLSHDLEYYDPLTGEVVAWVNTNLTPTALNQIFVYYGKAGLAATEADPVGCWTGYLCVYNPSTGLDRTGNGRHLTPTAVTADSIFGAAGSFNGTTSQESRPLFNAANGLSALTVEAWVKGDTASMNRPIVAAGPATAPSVAALGLLLQYSTPAPHGATNTLRFKLQTSAGEVLVEGPAGIQLNTLQNVVGIWQSGVVGKIFTDTKAVVPTFASPAVTGTTLVGRGGGLFVGCSPTLAESSAPATWWLKPTLPSGSTPSKWQRGISYFGDQSVNAFPKNLISYEKLIGWIDGANGHHGQPGQDDRDKNMLMLTGGPYKNAAGNDIDDNSITPGSYMDWTQNSNWTALWELAPDYAILSWTMHFIPMDYDTEVSGRSATFWNEVIAGKWNQAFKNWGARMKRYLDAPAGVGSINPKGRQAWQIILRLNHENNQTNHHRVFPSTQLLYVQAADIFITQFRIGLGPIHGATDGSGVHFAHSPGHTTEGAALGSYLYWCPTKCDILTVSIHPSDPVKTDADMDDYLTGTTNPSHYSLAQVLAACDDTGLPFALLEWSPKNEARCTLANTTVANCPADKIKWEVCPIAHRLYEKLAPILQANKDRLVCDMVFEVDTIDPDACKRPDSSAGAFTTNWKKGVQAYTDAWSRPGKRAP